LAASPEREKKRRLDVQINPMVVDLFHGDKVTSWSDLKATGIAGIIHKATESNNYIDPTYNARRQAATSIGFLWGAYHFMRPGDPVAAAHFFLQNADPDEEMLLALDHEDAAVPLANAVAWLKEVETYTGRQCVLYSGSLLKEQVEGGKANPSDLLFVQSRRLWMPEYSLHPRVPEGFALWLWQYTGDGDGPPPHSREGVDGHIDINSFDGTADQLTDQWAGAAVEAATA
jgi:lysozyme